MQLNVFDLDRTLVKVNSSFHFGLHLYKKKFFSFPALVACMSDYARHKWLGMPVSQLHLNAFKRLFKGKSLPLILHHVEEFLCKELDVMLNKGVLKKLQESQARGDYTMILSTSPDFLVGAVAKKLNVSLWEGTPYRANATGRLTEIGCVFEGKQKAEVVKEFSKKYKLPLASVIAYSDSFLDLPLLRIAGKAVAVNPDKDLKQVCALNNWEVL